MSADEALNRAEELLARLEAARQRLEGTEDPEVAIEILQELSDLAKAGRRGARARQGRGRGRCRGRLRSCVSSSRATSASWL